MNSQSPKISHINESSKHTRSGGTGGGDMDERFKRIETAIDRINATMDKLSDRVESMSVTLARIDERTKYLEVRLNEAPTKAWFYSTIAPVYIALLSGTLGAVYFFLKWLTPELVVGLLKNMAQ